VSDEVSGNSRHQQRETSRNHYPFASAEPAIEIEPVVPEKPIQPGMARNMRVGVGDAVHFDLVLATGCRAGSFLVTPRPPAVHQPLSIGPGALVEANLMHICGQPFSAPAQCSLLNLHGQKSNQHHEDNQATRQADNAYGPLSKGHIYLDTKDSESALG
jgi:hypothetical protein